MKPVIKAIKKPNLKLLDRLTESVENLQRVSVGVPSGKQEADGTSTALVAAVHEYGAPGAGIPERPFLRNTILAHLDDYKRLNRINVVKVLRGGMTMEVALGQLGLMAQGHVQQFIRNNDYALSEKTKKRKGSTKALIDTGQLVQSITFEIDHDKHS